MKSAIAAVAVGLACWAAGLSASARTLDETASSFDNERIEATQSGDESDSYTVTVPSGKRATVHVRLNSISSSYVSSRSVRITWNGADQEFLVAEGDSTSKRFDASGSVVVQAKCSPDTHNVKKTWYDPVSRTYKYRYETDGGRDSIGTFQYRYPQHCRNSGGNDPVFRSNHRYSDRGDPELH